MLAPEQIALRRTGVTSTDIAAICGLNPYKPALEVYAEKLGAAPQFEDNEACYWGRALEDVIAARYEEGHPGMELFGAAGTMSQEGEPWLLATPDRLVFQTKINVPASYGLEIKTTASAKQVERWGNEGDAVPLEYLVQCQWCMLVTGLRRWDMAVLLGTYHGFEYREYQLEYNARNIVEHPTKGLLARGRHFWFDHVLARVEPDPDGSESAQRAILAMHPKADLKVKLAMTDAEKDALEDYQGAYGDLKLMEEKEALARQKLELAIGDAEGIEHPEIGTVIWKCDKRGRRRIWRPNLKGVK